MINTTLISIGIGAITAIAGLARLYFYWQGKRVQRLEDELNEKDKILDNQLRKKAREDILRRNPTLRKRLLDRYVKKDR